MAGNLPASGKIVKIEEISQNLESYEGKSIRITGSLTHHNFRECEASLSTPNSQHRIQIDTKLVEPFKGVLGSLYQFIGEIERTEDGSGFVLKPRIVRNVDGLDLTMYHKAVDIFNGYFNKESGTAQAAS